MNTVRVTKLPKFQKIFMELENMDPKLSKNGLKTLIRCLDQFLEEFEASIKCGNFGQNWYF